MALRPGRCYNKPYKKPYTRIAIRVPKKSYVKGAPPSKIVHFEMGTKGDYPLAFHLVIDRSIAIRSNALEAARVAAQKYLGDTVGVKNYFLKVRVVPYHVLRENPLATGAGADRFSQGMRRAFGKPIGIAALVKKGQKIMTVYIHEGKENIAKEALRRAAMKLPGSYKIVKEVIAAK
ncbi:MAG TPA: 50S ribosomal protein L16 [Nanoarchaeota archaeon]|nr:50S ribosomal protein L16 [Nanoarchaeota archaeon]